MDFSQEDLDINGAIKRMNNKDQRIKELESTVLDLQSELARKKMSLSVACNRVEELEGKLKVAVDALAITRSIQKIKTNICQQT